MSRSDFKVTAEMADKTEMFVQSEGGGVRKVEVEEERRKSSALSDDQAVTIARLLKELENELGTPQDFEWGIEKGINLNFILTCSYLMCN